MASSVLDAKLLPKSVPSYYHSGPWEQILVKFELKDIFTKNFVWENMYNNIVCEVSAILIKELIPILRSV